MTMNNKATILLSLAILALFVNAQSQFNNQCLNCLHSGNYFCGDSVCRNAAQQSVYTNRASCFTTHTGTKQNQYIECIDYAERLTDYQIVDDQPVTIVDRPLAAGKSLLLQINNKVDKSAYINITHNLKSDGEKILFFAFSQSEPQTTTSSSFATSLIEKNQKLFEMTGIDYVLLPQSDYYFYVWLGALSNQTNIQLEILASGSNYLVTAMIVAFSTVASLFLF